MAKYPPKTDEAIWALACDGFKPHEIREALANDSEIAWELGGPVEMPARTLSEKLSRLKKERGEPVSQIKAGEELAVAAVLERRILEIGKRHLEREVAKDEPDLNIILKLQQLVARSKDSIRRKDPQAQAAAEARHRDAAVTTPSRSLLAEIAKAEEARERSGAGS